MPFDVGEHVEQSARDDLSNSKPSLASLRRDHCAAHPDPRKQTKGHENPTPACIGTACTVATRGSYAVELPGRKPNLHARMQGDPYLFCMDPAMPSPSLAS